MGLVVKIKGDFKGTSVEAIEQYVRAMLAESTGESVGRVVNHGVVKTTLDEVREAFHINK